MFTRKINGVYHIDLNRERKVAQTKFEMKVYLMYPKCMEMKLSRLFILGNYRFCLFRLFFVRS